MDAPDEPHSPAHFAALAAEAVRGLNRVTLWRSGGYEEPGDVDAVLTELHLLMQRLPQALTQARDWIERAALRDDVRHDAGEPAGPTVTELARLLNVAAGQARQLEWTFGEARRHSSHLGG